MGLPHPRHCTSSQTKTSVDACSQSEATAAQVSEKDALEISPKEATYDTNRRGLEEKRVQGGGWMGRRDACLF